MTDGASTATRSGTADLDAAFAAALERTGRYRRDTRLGRILHPGHVSVREVCPSASVHLAFRGNRVTAHVDRHSPLNCGSRRRSHYSVVAVAVHNVADVIVATLRALAGRRRDRCEFTCERVWVEDA